MGAVNREHLCPVCGYDLDFQSWDGQSPSDEICPCCNIQFGYDDAAGGDTERRREIHAKWRADWIDAGMPWRGHGHAAPNGWDPRKQCERIINDA